MYEKTGGRHPGGHFRLILSCPYHLHKAWNFFLMVETGTSSSQHIKDLLPPPKLLKDIRV
jgi:hypothetical protein